MRPRRVRQRLLRDLVCLPVVAPAERFHPAKYLPAVRRDSSTRMNKRPLYTSLYIASIGSKRMDAIGDARSSSTPAEMLDAITLLHASGVGSVNRSRRQIS
ncbi:hypothetical protein EAI_01455 [Harpegnathos saltator]|uniref:Uncharacterized protein n=1 Tax=Harpegnathos saltator TaxID=610380 RepID=E2BMG8_HARSA|nr:hypothetical protein EAI_01455 [Harpegnathos saltator]